MTTQTINRGTLAALFVATVWGLSFVAASVVLTTLSPILLATLRFIIASILFSPILARAIGSVNTRFLLGVACLLGNAVSFSIYSTISRKILKKYSEPAIVTSYVTVFGTLALIPLSLTSDWSTIWALTQNQWIAVLFLASICSGLAYFLWNYALSRIDSVQAAVWLYLEPVVAFIGLFILYGSIPSSLTIMGGILVLVGAAFTSKPGK